MLLDKCDTPHGLILVLAPTQLYARGRLYLEGSLYTTQSPASAFQVVRANSTSRDGPSNNFTFPVIS